MEGKAKEAAKEATGLGRAKGGSAGGDRRSACPTRTLRGREWRLEVEMGTWNTLEEPCSLNTPPPSGIGVNSGAMKIEWRFIKIDGFVDIATTN